MIPLRSKGYKWKERKWNKWYSHHMELPQQKNSQKEISKPKKRAKRRDLANWRRKQDVETVAACCSWGGGAIFCIPCVHFQTLLLGHKLSLAWIQVSGSLKQKVHQFFIPAFTGFLQIYVLFVNLQFVYKPIIWMDGDNLWNDLAWK